VTADVPRATRGDGPERWINASLEVRAGADPIQGALHGAQEQVRFVGWLELASALERLTQISNEGDQGSDDGTR